MPSTAVYKAYLYSLILCPIKVSESYEADSLVKKYKLAHLEFSSGTLGNKKNGSEWFQ